MIDAEDKALREQAQQEDQGQEQQQTEEEVYDGPLDGALVESYYTLTSSMASALQRTKQIHFSETLERPERRALDALFMAKNARDVETDGTISGMKRAELLNQALIYLQPMLSLGLRPDFEEGRDIYKGLVGQITDAREEIKTAIKLENYIPVGVAKKDASREQDDDEEDPDDTGDDASADTGEGPMWEGMPAGHKPPKVLSAVLNHRSQDAEQTTADDDH